MATDILKEFLVAIGFEVNENSYKRQRELITAVEKQLVGNDKAAKEREAGEKVRLAGQTLRAAEVASNLRMVGAAVAGFATLAVGAFAAVTTAVKNGIGEFDRLAYISGRTGASVNNIKAIGYAFSQTGSSAEAAVQALESFAKARRANPGVDAMLRSYGVDTKGDASEVLSNSLDAIIKRHPQYTSQQIAGLFGISADEVDHWIRYRKEIEQFQKQYKDLQRTFGVNGGDMARASTAISRALGEWSAVVEVLRDKLVSLFLPAIESVAKALSELLKHLTNEENVTAFVAYFDKPLAALKELVRWVGVLYEQFVRLFEYVRNSPIGKIIGAINPGYFREKFLDAITPGGAQASEGPGGGGASGGGGSRAGGEGASKPGIIRRGLNALKRGLGIGGDKVDTGPIKPGEHPILDLITKAEGTKRGYNDSFAHQIPGELVGKTLDEIDAIQGGMKGSSAIGKYQFMRKTLRGLRKELGLKGTDLFSPEMQDRLALQLYRRRMAQAKREGGGRRAVLKALAQEWASFPTESGEGYYPGQRAAVTPDQVMKAVEGEESNERKRATDNRPIIAPSPKAGRAQAMTPGSFNVDDYLRSQPMGTQSSNTDNSKTVTMTAPVSVTVNGGSDPQATGAAVGRAVGQANDMSLRNVQTAIR